MFHHLVRPLAAAVPVVLLTVSNRAGGGAANLLTAALNWHWQADALVYALANPALAAADLDAVLQWLLLHPVHGVTQNPIWPALLALPGGGLLAWLVWCGRRRSLSGELASSVFAASIACIVLAWTVSSAVSVEARHLAPAALAVLPLALAEGGAMWRRSAGPARACLVAAASVFVAVPLAYGPVSVAAKVLRQPREYRPGPSGLYASTLARQDAGVVVSTLQARFNPATDLWYLPEPMTALDLRGRRFVRHADFIDVSELAKDRFVTSRPLRVHVLLPPRFEDNGKARTIRASFLSAGGWERTAIAGSEYVDWTADLAVRGASSGATP